MNNYLTRLAARSLGLAKTIKPRMPSVFEPAGVADWQFFEFDGEASSLESMDEIHHEMSGEASSDIQPSTNTRRREKEHSVDRIRNKMPQLEDPSAVSNGESNSNNTSLGLDQRIEAKDLSLSSAGSKIGEEAREEVQLRDIRSAGILPRGASHDAASSAAIQEEDAIHSQDEDHGAAIVDLSKARLRKDEKTGKNQYHGDIRSAGILPRGASHDAASSAAFQEEDAIHSQDEDHGAAIVDLSKAGLRKDEKTGKNQYHRDIRSTGILPRGASNHAASSAAIQEEDAIHSQESGTPLASASSKAVSAAAIPEKGEIRLQDKRPSAVGQNIKPPELEIGEKAKEKSHVRKTQPAGPSPIGVSHEASSPAVIMQKDVRSQDPGAVWAYRSSAELRIGENLRDGEHHRKIRSIEVSMDRALHIPVSSEAEFAIKIGNQDQRAGNGSRLYERKQNSSLPSISPSKIMEDNSISSPTPAASSLYKNDSSLHLKNRRIPNSRKISKSAGFAKKLTIKGIERKMPTPKRAKGDESSASIIRATPQHGFVSVHHEDNLIDSDSAAHKSEPRTPMQPFAGSLLRSVAQRYEKRAQADIPESFKSEGEGNNASISTVHKANQTAISFKRRFSAHDTARPKVDDEIDLERDFLGSGILNPDPRMVQVMMPPGPPAKRHESPTGRNFAGWDNGESPEVHVTIGRIEVRAVTSPEPQKKRGSPETVGLDEYLRERSGGKR